MKPDYLIVGAGFAGCVVAEQLASNGFKVLLIDKRLHIGGNAYDQRDEYGVLIHPYGPHIFHTNSEKIYKYLSRFTAWRFYEHRVRAIVNGVLYPVPINQDTVNQLYGLNLDEEGVSNYFEAVRIPICPLQTSKDVVLNSVGQDLYEKFFKNYTRKQWGLDASELSAGVAARIPVRCNRDDRYFTDKYQIMPLDGYTAMFEQMLADPSISIQLGIDFDEIRDTVTAPHVVYTGPIDAYFKYSLGCLPYRSLQFEHAHLPDQEHFQPVGTVNYPNDEAFTRITEFKHLTGEQHQGTSIVREYPCADGEPYYPIPRPENEALFKQYEALAAQEPNVTFVGRLAQYRYYNMDQVIGAALKAAERILARTGGDAIEG